MKHVNVCKRVIKRMVCYIHTLSYSVERLRYYVKIWVILSMKYLNLLKQSVIMLNGSAVLSTQYLIMLKGYVVKWKSWVILSTKHVNLSIQTVTLFNGRVVLSTQCFIMLKTMLLCWTHVLFSPHSVLIC